jgi:hypothetical protein
MEDMKMQRLRALEWSRLAILGFALALVALAPAHAGRRMTSDFRTTETRPMTIALLPPRAEFIKAKAVMTEEMVDECRALEQSASSWIDKFLEEKGYTVKIVTLDDATENSELRELLHRVNDRYQEEWVRIMRAPKGVRQDRYELGVDAQELAALLEVDGLVIPRILAVGVTMGKAMLTGLLSGGQAQAQGYASIDLSVVDGDTGDIEAFFYFSRGSTIKALTKQPDKVMMKVTKGVLKKYPESTEILPPKGPDSGEEDEDIDEKQEAALLAELEVLLGSEESAETGEAAGEADEETPSED